MYRPRAFDQTDPAELRAFIARHGFATLVTADLQASHLPLLLEGDTLLGHVARANPHWQALEAGAPALAIFHGPHAYISPAWYTRHPAVPTWNYAVVHVTGRPRLLARAELDRAIPRLVEAYETEGWSMAGLPPGFAEGMLDQVVGIALDIERIEGKQKLSQNRTIEDRRGVVAGLRRSARPDAVAMAELMAETVL